MRISVESEKVSRKHSKHVAMSGFDIDFDAHKIICMAFGMREEGYFLKKCSYTMPSFRKQRHEPLSREEIMEAISHKVGSEDETVLEILFQVFILKVNTNGFPPKSRQWVRHLVRSQNPEPPISRERWEFKSLLTLKKTLLDSDPTRALQTPSSSTETVTTICYETIKGGDQDTFIFHIEGDCNDKDCAVDYTELAGSQRVPSGPAGDRGGGGCR